MLSNPYVLLTIASLSWGGNSVAGKLATGAWQPLALSNLRWLLVATILLPFVWSVIKRDWQQMKAHVPLLLLLGCVMSGFNMLMFVALNYTSAINVSIEQAFMPILIILANFVFMSQRVRSLQLVGVMLSIIGVLVIGTAGKPWLLLEQGVNIGDALMLLACVFYAGYTYSLRWKPKMHWLAFMFFIALGAFTASLPFALYELGQGKMSHPALQDWLVLGYILLFPSILSQIFFARGVELIGSNRGGLFINLVPVFGSILAVLILGEYFELFHAVGLVLVIGGIMLAEKMAEKTSTALPEN